MSFLSILPSLFSCEVLGTWCSEKSLRAFDTAACNAQIRKLYLNSLSHSYFILSDQKIDIKLYPWIALRGIKIIVIEHLVGYLLDTSKVIKIYLSSSIENNLDSMRGLVRLINSCPLLIELGTGASPETSCDDLSQINPTILNQLTFLHIRFFEDTFSKKELDFLAQHCSNLVTFILGVDSGEICLMENSLIPLVKNNPKLAEFIISTELYPSPDNNECLLTVLDTNCPNIESFSGSFCREVSPVIINKYLNSKKMFSFDIGLFLREARIFITQVKKKLKLTADGSWYDGPYFNTNYLAFLLNGVQNLVRIELTNIKDQMFQPILHNIARNSPNIEYLSLKGCNANDLMTSMPEIITKCHKLNELHLIHCRVVNSANELINAFSPSDSLKTLTITTQEHLTTQTVIEIYRRNPKLIVFKNPGGGYRVIEDDVRAYLKANKRYENGFSMV